MENIYSKFKVVIELEMIHDGSITASEVDCILGDEYLVEQGIRENWIKFNVLDGMTLQETRTNEECIDDFKEGK